MIAKKYLIRTETIVHKLVVNAVDGTAVGLVETVYYAPLVTGGRVLHRSSMSCICHDIYRRQVLWMDSNNMDELLPKYNTAKSLSRRLRTEINKLVAEGKVNGESISGNADRQPTARTQESDRPATH